MKNDLDEDVIHQARGILIRAALHRLMKNFYGDKKLNKKDTQKFVDLVISVLEEPVFKIKIRMKHESNK